MNSYNETITVVEDMGAWWVGLIFTGFTIFVSLMIEISENSTVKEFAIGIIFAVVFGVVIGITCQFRKVVRQKTTDNLIYEVTISDNVSFDEFADHYEIIEQRGQIYVVKERERTD